MVRKAGKEPACVSDDDLLERATQFDQEALAEIYDRYAQRLYQYIYHRVGERELAEDLTGEVFVRMLEAIGRGSFARVSLRAWLYRIAHNLVIDHYRAQPSEEPVLLDDGLRAVSGDSWAPTDAWLAQVSLRAALNQLPETQQQVIVLRFGEGLTAPEVAEVLGKTEGAVRALQHRAVAALRAILLGGEHA